MTFLNQFIYYIDCCSEWLGRVAAWMGVLMVVMTCYVVVTRYAFNVGSIAVQETVIYLNALLFMLSAGFTFKHNAHVRVDVIYGKASPRYRELTDLLGTLFLLLPVCLFIFIYSWDYVAASWRIQEQSRDPGGLPWVYLLKTLILVLPVALILQGVADALRNLITLCSPYSHIDAAQADDDDNSVSL